MARRSSIPDKTIEPSKEAASPIAKVERFHFIKYADDSEKKIITNRDYRNSRLVDANGKGITFEKCDFSYSIFERAYFRDAVFRQCKFVGVRFIDSNLRQAHFSRCDLSYAEFLSTVLEVRDVVASLPIQPNIVAGTLVHTPDGLKQIEDIAEGDIVYALNLATGKQVARPVLGAIETHPQACVSISLSDGTTIETTPDHRFYEGSLESWVAAESLGPGSQLVSGDTDVTVYSVAGMRCPAPAYSITVEADANFLVGINGVLAHNDDLCQINRNIVRQGVKDGQSVDDIVRALRGQPPVQTTKAMRELIRQARAIKDSVLQKHPSLILPGTKTIAVAPSFPDGRTSGYKHIDDVERVLVKGNGLRPFGYSIRGAGSFDPIRKAGDAYGPVGKRATGLYNASHAEKQMNHVLGAKDEPTGISKFMCGDCLSYFRATARSTGRDYVFADPYTTYYFRANGQVVVVPH